MCKTHAQRAHLERGEPLNGVARLKGDIIQAEVLQASHCCQLDQVLCFQCEVQQVQRVDLHSMLSFQVGVASHRSETQVLANQGLPDLAKQGKRSCRDLYFMGSTAADPVLVLAPEAMHQILA